MRVSKRATMYNSDPYTGAPPVVGPTGYGSAKRRVLRFASGALMPGTQTLDPGIDGRCPSGWDLKTFMDDPGPGICVPRIDIPDAFPPAVYNADPYTGAPPFIVPAIAPSEVINVRPTYPTSVPWGWLLAGAGALFLLMRQP